MQTLIELYRVHAPSGREQKMMEYLRARCQELGAEVHSDRKGNLYAIKGVSDTYPCVVAHTDQVQHTRSPNFEVIVREYSASSQIICGGYYDKKGRFIYEGLGADDKNGIWCALKLLESEEVMKCAFFVEEEIGCRGSAAADMRFFDNVRFVLQADRRGANDFITSIYEEMMTREFYEDANPEAWHFYPENGMMTDVAELFSRGVGVCCCNISCGYYHPHTDREFTSMSDLWRTLDFMRHIVRDCTEVYPCQSSYGELDKYDPLERVHFSDDERLYELL